MPRLCPMPILESISNFLSRSLFQLPFYRQFCRPLYCIFLMELWLVNFPGKGPIKNAERSN